MGNQALEDSMVSDGLTDKFNDYHMGITAENLVENMVSLEKSKISLLRTLNKRLNTHKKQVDSMRRLCQ